MQQRVRLGISSCLLGNAVRWNAGHKLDRFLTDTLGQFVDYVPVCPDSVFPGNRCVWWAIRKTPV
jgi:uncharacterized protein YbbK (DUF523 family)